MHVSIHEIGEELGIDIPSDIKSLSISQRAMICAKIKYKLNKVRISRSKERENTKRKIRAIKISRGRKEPCAICGGWQELTHAHHLVPVAALADAFDDVYEARKYVYFVWLCPNHHSWVHAWDGKLEWSEKLWTLLEEKERGIVAGIFARKTSIMVALRAMQANEG